MAEKPPRKTHFSGNPFDLNRNGKIDPVEVASIMMIIDAVNNKRETDTDIVKDNIVEIDDMDIEGI